jgi:hypothetical protein
MNWRRCASDRQYKQSSERIRLILLVDSIISITLRLRKFCAQPDMAELSITLWLLVPGAEIPDHHAQQYDADQGEERDFEPGWDSQAICPT